jgi:LmbE family N-acetylglucosaminyl deacetylase
LLLVALSLQSVPSGAHEEEALQAHPALTAVQNAYEAGEISDPTLATPERLGEVRENELRCAAGVLGAKELRFLDYVDGQLEQSDPNEVIGKIVLAIRELRPQVIITFGPEGIYGHPDHIAIGKMTTQAFQLAGDPGNYPDQLVSGLEAFAPQKLYYRILVRNEFKKMFDEAAQAGLKVDLGNIDVQAFGSDESEVTTVVDVLDYIDLKTRATECHKTQIQPNHPFSKLPPEKWREFSRREQFKLAISTVGQPAAIETDLFEGIR